MSDEPREVRPNRRVFVLRATVRAALFTLPLLLLAGAVAPVMDWSVGAAFAAGFALWIALVVVRFAERRVVFAKTLYKIYPDRLVLETGSFFSERSVDLQFSNVTRTNLLLPFIEHRLYETGHVTVQAAGSAAAEVSFESIDEPRQVYDAISDALRENGFSLARERKLQEEKPGLVGSLHELGAPVVTIGAVIFAFVPDLLSSLGAAAEDEAFSRLLNSFFSADPVTEQAVQFSGWSIAAAAVLAIGIAFATIGFFTLRWMDILKRTYTLYDDVIDYSDGFLTIRESFIPVENLTDVEINETLVQRMLSISTLSVSCQGAGTEIRLAALPNGQTFKARLEQLIDEADSPRQRVASTEVPGGDQAPATVGDVEFAPEDAMPSEAEIERLPRVEGSYDWKRGVAGPVAGTLALGLFVLVGIAIAVIGFPEMDLAGVIGTGAFAAFLVAATTLPQIVKIVFHAYAVTYTIDERKVTHTYELLSRKQTEFTVDKISAVDVRRTPIDRLFKTARVSFTSIGSQEQIKFEHLQNADEVVDGVLTRMGIDPEAIVERSEPSHSVAAQARAIDGGTIAMILLSLTAAPAAVLLPMQALALIPAGLGVVGLFGHTIYLRFFHERARLDVGETWIGTRTGLWARHRYFTPDRHVRGIVVRENVGEERGLVSVRSGGGARTELGYVHGVRALQDRIDERLHSDDAGEPLDRDVVNERKPSALLAGVRGATIAVFTVVLLPVLPVVVGWAVVAARRITFRLEGSRIARLSGVFRRARHTILLGRIDHLTTKRGPLNRMTKTGSIGVRTLGSQGTDLLVRDVRDHQRFYETVESMTKRQLGRAAD